MSLKTTDLDDFKTHVVADQLHVTQVCHYYYYVQMLTTSLSLKSNMLSILLYQQSISIIIIIIFNQSINQSIDIFLPGSNRNYYEDHESVNSESTVKCGKMIYEIKKF